MTRGKLSTIVTLGLAATLAAGVAAARRQAPAAEQELRAEAETFAAGWNHADGKAMAALFAEDADLINPFNHSAKGRAGIEKFFANELSTLTKGTTFAVKSLTARMIRPDLAFEDLEVEISGGNFPKPLDNHAFMVSRKQGGHWHILALRAYSFLPPPPSAPAKP